jgi:hypothetical protein
MSTSRIGDRIVMSSQGDRWIATIASTSRYIKRSSKSAKVTVLASNIDEISIPTAITVEIAIIIRGRNLIDHI